MEKQRIAVLDSFRCLAIMAVVLVHYTYRWRPPAYPVNLYPYGNFYGTVFHYGYMGVQFFFIISGFVISYTLEHTQGIAAFFKNRFIRLWPPMLLCTVATFLACIALDNQYRFENAHSMWNFGPSLTFTKPSIWQVLTGRSWSYISGCYWSLWVEVQFYVFSSVLFFTNKRSFFRNLILLTAIFNILNYVPDSFVNPATYPHASHWMNMFLKKLYFNRGHFDITGYIDWFTIGAIFHHLYKQREIRWRSLTGISVLFIFLNQLYQCNSWQEKAAYIIMLCLFACLIYRSQYLFFLDNTLFRRIGFISYTVYLIHEIIGVLLINRFGGYLGRWSPLAPFITAALMISFAEISYRVYEKRAARWLKVVLFAKPKGLVSGGQIVSVAPDG